MKRTVFYDGLYGLAVADALGVPYETEKLEAMREHPCTGMVGYKHHNQPAGSWSDDTSMTLCVADSLCRDFDIDDMMKRFSRWRGNGEYTATGKTFDVGRTCRRAINQYWDGTPAEYCGDATEKGNGNGALMRMLPMALYQCRYYTGNDDSMESFLEPIHLASSITHAHVIGLICCGMFSLVLRELLCCSTADGSLGHVVQTAYEKGKRTYTGMGGDYAKYVNDPEYFDDPVKLMTRSEEELPTWGYALNTWNIALWSLLTTDNYCDCVLKAVNLGGDTDTNAAVAGALAGVIYGKDSIPVEWINALLNKTLLDQVASNFTRKLFGGSASKTVIDQFENEYAFLAMKAPSTIILDGRCYEDVGAAYYALSVPEEHREQFVGLGSRKARKKYKDLPHLDSSEEHVEEKLYRIVRTKYEQHPDELEKLKNTGSLEIIYDTSGSHDNILGRCRCKECQNKEYRNLYGRVMMRVRAE